MIYRERFFFATPRVNLNLLVGWVVMKLPADHSSLLLRHELEWMINSILWAWRHTLPTVHVFRAVLYLGPRLIHAVTLTAAHKARSFLSLVVILVVWVMITENFNFLIEFRCHSPNNRLLQLVSPLCFTTANNQRIILQERPKLAHRLLFVFLNDGIRHHQFLHSFSLLQTHQVILFCAGE